MLRSTFRHQTHVLERKVHVGDVPLSAALVGCCRYHDGEAGGIDIRCVYAKYDTRLSVINDHDSVTVFDYGIVLWYSFESPALESLCMINVAAFACVKTLC